MDFVVDSMWEMEIDWDWTLSVRRSYSDYYSGHEKQRRNSVAFIVRKVIERIVLGYNAVTESYSLDFVDNPLI